MLTEKESLIYEYIEDFTSENGYPPTIRDILSYTGIKSTSTVYAYIEKLEQKGFITKKSGKSRSLQPAARSNSDNEIRVPVLGRITAGVPISAIENYEGYVSFDTQGKLFGKKDLFALKVRGLSMIDAGILDGDIVIVRKCETAENGDIVVAMIDDEATVKVFYKENGVFRLQPQNPTMEPIITNDLVILGQVVASMRYYD